MRKIKMVIPKQNSPITAIRRYCVECSGGGRKEVAECHIYRCPLFPYRFGCMPDTYVAGKEDEVEIINERGKVIKNVRKKDSKRNEPQTEIKT